MEGFCVLTSDHVSFSGKVWQVLRLRGSSCACTSLPFFVLRSVHPCSHGSLESLDTVTHPGPTHAEQNCPPFLPRWSLFDRKRDSVLL